MHSGNKYHRRINGIDRPVAVTVDVYCVLEAFDVQCPARQHAIKKLLCAGLRGKGDAVQDLREAGDAIARAVMLEEQRVGYMKEKNERFRAAYGGAEAPLEATCPNCQAVTRYHHWAEPPLLCPQCQTVCIPKPMVDPVWDDAQKKWVEPVPTGHLMQALCTKCGDFIRYNFPDPAPVLCPRCAEAPTHTPVKGNLRVETLGGLVHTTCMTCHNRVTYNLDVRRPALCRLCVPTVEEVGPPA